MGRNAWLAAAGVVFLEVFSVSSCSSNSPSNASGGAGMGSALPAGGGSGMTSTSPINAGTGGAQGGGGAAQPGGGAGASGAKSVAGSSANAGTSATAGVSGTLAGNAGASGAAGGAGSGAPDACDRACLIAVFDGYLAALAARDASKIKVAATLKYTENGMTVKVGDGLWKTASKIETDTRFSYADPMTGQVGGQLVMDENGSTPVLYQARLKVVNHEITEIESMAVRQAGAANGFFSVPGMKPEAVWAQAIDPSKRLTRDQLKMEVDHYIDYLDGKTNSSGVHLDMGCARYENGVQTASGAGFALQMWSFDVVPRYLIFDEEYGIAWGMFPFTHDPMTLVVGEAFKVMDGKIMMIRAVMANMPAMAWN